MARLGQSDIRHGMDTRAMEPRGVTLCSRESLIFQLRHCNDRSRTGASDDPLGRGAATHWILQVEARPIRPHGTSKGYVKGTRGGERQCLGRCAQRAPQPIGSTLTAGWRHDMGMRRRARRGAMLQPLCAATFSGVCEVVVVERIASDGGDWRNAGGIEPPGAGTRVASAGSRTRHAHRGRPVGHANLTKRRPQ